MPKIIAIPGSKSITNRALLIAALAHGKSVLKNCLSSDDTVYMQKALSKLGIEISKKKNDFVVKSKGQLGPCKSPLFLGNAGTAVRFLTAACTLGTAPYTITGDANMQKRPIFPLIEALKSSGLEISAHNGCPPVQILAGQFTGGKITIDGSLSSQFISALLMIAPRATKYNTEIIIKNDLTSKPYIDVTLNIMKQFGIKVKNNNYKSFTIQKNQKYQAQNFTVEGDYSSASYFAAIALINNIKITLKNLTQDSAQGDKRFLDLIKKMGGQISWTKNKVSIQGTGKIKNVGEIDMNDIPDMVPTMAILAAVTEGKTKIVNVANLRIKETDRLQALENELQKIGVKAKAGKDSLSIWGNPHSLQAATISTYHDHRIAMSFACLATIIPGLKIANPDCVKKSYPRFWLDLQKLGIKIKSPSKS